VASTSCRSLSAPPEAVALLRVKPSGASLKAKLTVAVSLALSSVSEIDTRTFGAVSSTVSSWVAVVAGLPA